MTEELKAAIEAIKKSHVDFKKANDEALAQMASKGHVDSILQEKVDKLNVSISEGTDRLDGLEKRLNRADLFGMPGSDKESKEVAANLKIFQSMIRSEKPVSMEFYEGYRSAFDQYMRVGNDGLTSEMRATLSVGSDPNGGYWVLPDVSGRMVRLIFETSPIRQVASVQTISTDALEGRRDLDEAAQGWVGEQQARPATSTPEIGSWRIPVREQYAMPEATQKLLDDSSVDVETWLSGKISDKFAREENTAFVTGDGVVKPRGLLTYPSGVPTTSNFSVIEQVNTGASGAFASSNPGDPLIEILFKLKTAYRANARWMMARETLSEVRKLKDGQGNYLWQPNFQQLAAGMLLGFPITEGEDFPAIAANSLSIIFGNLAETYQIVDRAGIRVLRDPFTNKPFIRFYSTKRVGGDVVNFEAIKILKFAA